jgi:hypothetical protein
MYETLVIGIILSIGIIIAFILMFFWTEPYSVLYGKHIVFLLHKENDVFYIIKRIRVKALQEAIRLDNKKDFLVDTRKPSFILGNMRLYLVDTNTSQQISLKEGEKIIGMDIIDDFCYKKVLFNLSKSVHKSSLQLIQIGIGGLIGFALAAMIFMVLIYFEVF